MDGRIVTKWSVGNSDEPLKPQKNEKGTKRKGIR